MNRKPRQLKESDLRNQIEKLLSKNSKIIYNVTQISRKINVANPPDSILESIMRLVAEKKVVKLTEGRFKWERFQDQQNPKGKLRRSEDIILYTGIVDMTRSGAAYIINSESVEDIYIHARNLKGALHKDEVTVSVSLSKAHRRPEGVVVSVDKRAHSRIIGHIRIFNNYAILSPDNARLYPEILIHHDDILESKDNDRVVAEIISWGRGQNKALWGKVIKVLEDISDVEMNMQAILYSNGFDPEFSDEVMTETASYEAIITDDDTDHRKDFRETITFTIDPLTARDFDDALSIKQLEDDHLEIGVHIADVTHYLREGTALDKEAYRRSTSVYLVDRVCPMLPEKLSNDLCSLNPNEDKLTFSAVFVFNKSYEITKEWFGKTIIHSDRRFTYEEAQESIETGQGDFCDELLILDKIAKHLRNKRYDEGSISFESDEVQFILDDDGMPLGMKVKERKDAHMLVEDFMLLANRRVAAFVAKKSKPEIPFVYRVHDLPNPEKLSDFALFAAEMGFKFRMDTPEQIADSFNRLAVATHENPTLKLLEPLAIRTMAKAVYTTNNIGHYGLGFEYYTHFTSPIRRYSDVLVHRLLYKNLFEIYRGDKEKLESKTKHVSDQEKKASEAERESLKYFQTLYISKYVGHVFDGVVSGIIEKGIFVELPDTKVEGLVTFDSMGEIFNVTTGRLRAKSRLSGSEFSIGQKVRVKITAADPDSRRTDMILEES